MFRFVKPLLLSTCVLFVSILFSGDARAQKQTSEANSPLLVGFGVSDITPVRPTPMAGYYGVRFSTATHDPLWAKATVLDDGDSKVAIVVVDLISTNPWMVRETRKLIEDKLQIPASHVMISATHSHTGPMLYEPDERLLARFGNNTDEAKQYMIGLPERIAQSVFDAASNLKSRTVFHGIGEETKLAFNRRFFMKDGSVGWNPGKLNPNIVREAGPTDDALPFVAFFDEPGKLGGLLSSFAIHLDTVGGTQWSADMPFTIQESLRNVFGPDAHLQYATGTCGDINHIDVRTGARQGGHQEAARIGTRLAAAILRSWNQLQPADSTRLAASHQIVRVPVNPHSSERSNWAKGVLAKMNDTPLPPFMEMVEAYRISDVEAHSDGFLDAEVQVISLGRDIAWVSLPGEIFVQLGMAIKDASPFANTSIHELANGSIGYVPTRQAYAQGNYEVISARCAQGSGEMMVDSAIAQLRQQFNSKQ